MATVNRGVGSAEGIAEGDIFIVELESELNLEWARFTNEWLFIWHNLSSANRIVDVDNFDGRRIQIGGVMFGGSTQLVYWDAIGRYLNQKVHEVFKQWDTETRSYPIKLRRGSIEGTEVLLQGFVGRIIQESIRTDRSLRGGGNPASVPAFDGTGYRTGGSAEIHRLAEAHRKLLDESIEKEVPPPAISWSKWVENVHADHKGKIYLVVAVAVPLIVAAWKLLIG